MYLGSYMCDLVSAWLKKKNTEDVTSPLMIQACTVIMCPSLHP